MMTVTFSWLATFCTRGKNCCRHQRVREQLWVGIFCGKGDAKENDRIKYSSLWFYWWECILPPITFSPPAPSPPLLKNQPSVSKKILLLYHLYYIKLICLNICLVFCEPVHNLLVAGPLCDEVARLSQDHSWTIQIAKHEQTLIRITAKRHFNLWSFKSSVTKLGSWWLIYESPLYCVVFIDFIFSAWLPEASWYGILRVPFFSSRLLGNSTMQ